MFVKICGCTRVEDAVAAADLGASAIGVVLWPRSPRVAGAAQARAIVRSLPRSVEVVGVFVNQPADEVNQLADDIGLSAVQLHGDEDEAFCARMTRRVIKSVTVSAGSFPPDGWAADVTWLIDAHDVQRRGGTGRPVDWQTAASMARRRPVLLAGGLTPLNVTAAIEQVRPFGIDVSSGVESAPGIKDVNQLRALFEAIHAGVHD